MTEITDEVVKNLSAIMDQAVLEPAQLEERFMVSLSGGMDSRAIASYLSKNYALKIMTYNLHEEVSIARRVCGAIGGEFHYLSNKNLLSDNFGSSLKVLIDSQKVHAVLNQYFHAPLFRQYFKNRNDRKALFDGIYLDMLFSIGMFWHELVPYDFQSFFHKHNSDGCSLKLIWDYYGISREEIVDTLEKVYYNTLSSFGPCDDVAKSNRFYYQGRLKRFANENVCAKENYCYVFRPGFDYNLADFAFSLDVKLRRGKLYQMLIRKKYPHVMKIKFKDSYNTRQESPDEKMLRFYQHARLLLSVITRGKFPYSTRQNEYYMLEKKKINDYKNMFLDINSISELISAEKKRELFKNAKRKYYFLGMFETALFLQQFYYKYGF